MRTPQPCAAWPGWPPGPLKRSASLPRPRGPTILRKSIGPLSSARRRWHDLRTPLAGIKVAVSSLRQSDATLPPEAQAELLATIEESTDTLSELVDNLLGLSRLQAGALSVHLDAVPLDAVVGSGAAPPRTKIDKDQHRGTR